MRVEVRYRNATTYYPHSSNKMSRSSFCTPYYPDRQNPKVEIIHALTIALLIKAMKKKPAVIQ